MQTRSLWTFLGINRDLEATNHLISRYLWSVISKATKMKRKQDKKKWKNWIYLTNISVIIFVQPAQVEFKIQTFFCYQLLLMYTCSKTFVFQINRNRKAANSLISGWQIRNHFVQPAQVELKFKSILLSASLNVYIYSKTFIFQTNRIRKMTI